MAEKILHLPASREALKDLRAGDSLLLYGEMYTARDAAHLRIFEALKKGEQPPVDLSDCAIYYAGPTPPPPGKVIGAVGPTTSSRMDAYTPALLAAGQTVMIGKGPRDPAITRGCIEHGAVYLAAIGGAGALIAGAVRAVEVVAYEDLGTEAIRRLTVEGFPAIVAIDAEGVSLYS